MTTATLVQTRIPLETLSMNSQPTSRRRSARLLAGKNWRRIRCAAPKSAQDTHYSWRRRTDRAVAYDEQDGDFKFTRASKKRKTEPTPSEPAPAPISKS